MLWIERVLAFELLPLIQREADSELLTQTIGEHLDHTQTHVHAIDQAFLAANAEPAAAASTALEGLRKHHDAHIATIVAPPLRDLFLSDFAARIEQLEIAIYSTLLDLAPLVEIDATPLQRSHDDNEHALRQLKQSTAKLRQRIQG